MKASAVGGQLGGERTGGRVHGRRWIHHPEPAVRELSMKRMNGHFWRHSVAALRHQRTPVLAAPMEGGAEGQDVDEKVDEELSVKEPRGNALAPPRLVSPLRRVESIRPGPPDRRERRR